MVLIELTTKDGEKYLYDFDSGWEVYDKGDQPAHWVNHREARNMYPKETYGDLKMKLRTQLLG